MEKLIDHQMWWGLTNLFFRGRIQIKSKEKEMQHIHIFTSTYMGALHYFVLLAHGTPRAMGNRVLDDDQQTIQRKMAMSRYICFFILMIPAILGSLLTPFVIMAEYGARAGWMYELLLMPAQVAIGIVLFAGTKLILNKKEK